MLCFQFLLALAVLGLLEFLGGFNGVCMLEETKQSFARFILPLMILNLLLQLGVVVDSYWGWRRVWRVVMSLCGNTNTVHPESGVENGDLQQQGEQSPEHISNLAKVSNLFLNITSLTSFLILFRIMCQSRLASSPTLQVF